MRCAFDMSAVQIYRTGREEEIPIDELLQLRTPLTQYAPDVLGVIPYILDNGAYSHFDAAAFERMAQRSLADPLCMFVIMPDVVGDHKGTIRQFIRWTADLGILDSFDFSKVGFVAQNGCSVETMPDILWDSIGCLFIGGDDEFKEGQDAFSLMEEARIRNKWVHVGRVNTSRKIVYFHGIADSFDGSGIARFTAIRQKAIRTLHRLDGTVQLRFSEWVE